MPVNDGDNQDVQLVDLASDAPVTPAETDQGPDYDTKIAAVEAKVVSLKWRLHEAQWDKRKQARELVTLKANVQKVFNLDQINKLSRLSTRGTQWSAETYKKALQLRFACGSTDYEVLLSQHQPLPSLRSLRRKMEVIAMEPGILYKVFDFLQLKVATMKEPERECCLTLDEMTIEVGLQFDRSSSSLCGNVTLPGHGGAATHALIFMLAGITSRWKQTIAYHFTGNSVNGAYFQPLVTEIVQRAHVIGLHVNAVTCDMGSPCADGRFLHFMYDVPHLIKNVKAGLVNGNEFKLGADIVSRHDLPSNVVSLGAIKELVTFQVNDDLKLTPNLDMEMVSNTAHFDKMKVGKALNFFSKSVSAGLHYLVENEGFDNALLTTAWFLDFMNTWFDLMSSRHPATALSKANTCAYEKAIRHLEETLVVFGGIECGKSWKPWQSGVILSTSSVLDIQRELLARGHHFVLTSRLTQDCLENLFGCVRFKNPVPNVLEFRQALKLITVAQFLKCPASGNYLEDDRSFLADFLDTPKEKPATPDECDEDTFSYLIGELLPDTLSKAQESSLYYLAGYCISSVSKSWTHCTTCLEAAEDRRKSLSQGSREAITRLKEYKEGALTHCSDEAFKLFREGEKQFRMVQDHLNGHNLVDKLVRRLSAFSVDIPDCHDLKTKLLTKFFTVRLYIYSKAQNSIRVSQAKVGTASQLGSKSAAMRACVKKIK